jgi:hypothetical protein
MPVISWLASSLTSPIPGGMWSYGAYSNVSRGKRRKGAGALQPATEEPEDLTPAQRERRRSWAELIRRVYEIDPLVCPGSERPRPPTRATARRGMG